MARYGSECKLYVGDLGNNASKPELEDAFSYYGPLRNVWVARNPPGFAFVEFEDARDAEDAVRGLDGRTICGRRARVEMSNGKNGGGGGGGGVGGGGRSGGFGGRGPPPRNSRSARPFHPDDRCYECGDRGHYARDCSRLNRRGGRRRSRSKSHSRSRSRSQSRRTRSATMSRSRSRSPRRTPRRTPRRSRTPRRTRTRSPRSASPATAPAPTTNGGGDRAD